MEPKEKAQSIHNKLGFIACDKSPKWENPHKFSTPKNRMRVAKNPFEPLLHEVMHTNIMSPSVFAAIPNKAPISDDKFCWSIEELATLKPIDIEKSPFVQSEATDHVMEAVAQAKINKFFSAKTILPSPAGPSGSSTSKPLISTTTPTSTSSLAVTPSPTEDISTPSSTTAEESICSPKNRRKVRTTASQTYLSLPAVLPAAVEKVLNQYMQGDGRIMGKLYPDGFDSSEEESPKRSPPKAIEDLSPFADSPLEKPLHDSLYSESQTRDSWQLSPIATLDDDNSGTSAYERLMRNRRSVAKLDFSAGHMSVDLSLPQLQSSGDDLDGLEYHNSSLHLHLDNTPTKKPNRSPSLSPLPQGHNTSAPDSTFSRMEDDFVTFHRSRSIEMDISVSNTPKSRSASGTRRRLCDSFASFESEDEKEAEEEHPGEEVEDSGSSKKYKIDSLTRNHELTDTGYNTASTFEESSLCFEKNTNVFASTPTKTKIPFFPVNE